LLQNPKKRKTDQICRNILNKAMAQKRNFVDDDDDDDDDDNDTPRGIIANVGLGLVAKHNHRHTRHSLLQPTIATF
jgi:hypothetical protein